MVARGDDALVAQHRLLRGQHARGHVVVHGAREAVEAAEVEGDRRRPDGHHPRVAVVLPEAEQRVQTRWLRQLDGVVGRAVGGEHADAVRAVQDLEGREVPVQHRQATQHPVALGHQLGPVAAVGGGGQRDRDHPSAVGTGRGDADEGLATKAADEVARAWVEQGLPVRAARPPDVRGCHRRASALHRQRVTAGLDDDHHHAAVEAALVHRRPAQAVQHRAQGAAIDHRGLGVADVEAAAVRQPAGPRQQRVRQRVGQQCAGGDLDHPHRGIFRAVDRQADSDVGPGGRWHRPLDDGLRPRQVTGAEQGAVEPVGLRPDDDDRRAVERVRAVQHPQRAQRRRRGRGRDALEAFAHLFAQLGDPVHSECSRVVGRPGCSRARPPLTISRGA